MEDRTTLATRESRLVPCGAYKRTRIYISTVLTARANWYGLTYFGRKEKAPFHHHPHYTLVGVQPLFVNDHRGFVV